MTGLNKPQAHKVWTGLNGVLSHVSVAASAASATVMPTCRYFGTTHHLAAELNAHQVICPKHARGAHGSRDYAHHQEAATKALPNPLLWQSTSMLRMQKGKPQTSMQISSQNTQGILLRSKKPSSNVWMHGTWLVPSLFLTLLIPMHYQLRIAVVIGRRLVLTC